jgi:glutamate-ammonia-ligase adenylyltransferase
MTAIDSALVRRSIERSADPLTGRAALSRLLDAHPGLSAELRPMRVTVVAVAVASRSLLAVLERDERALDMLRDEQLRATVTARELATQANAALAAADPPAALRRWKHRQIVRIAGRDLLAIADLRAVGADLAAVAQAALETALAVAAPTVPMAVIGMGKLGGIELNYASDVDVVFVHEGDTAAAGTRGARAVRVMTEPSAGGIVFRTDADCGRWRAGRVRSVVRSTPTRPTGSGGPKRGSCKRLSRRGRSRATPRSAPRSSRGPSPTCGPMSSTRPRCTRCAR